MHPHATPAPLPRPWARHLPLIGPVTICTGAALVLALRALPLAGGARLVFAAAVALDVGLLSLSSWSSVLGAVAAARGRKNPRPLG